VVLVEREASFVFAPSLTWLMTGDRTEQGFPRPLERLVPGGIEVVRGEIEHIDPERGRVTVSGAARDADHLVIALGAEIALYAAEAAPMATAGPEVAKGVRQMIETKAIAYHPEHQVVAADGAQRLLQFANGATTGYDLLVFVPPHRAPGVVRASGLAPEGGWMATDRRTLRTSHDRVHAIGDVTSIPLASGRPLPKAGVFAHRQAEVVAHNIASEILGRGRLRTFDGVGECFIEAGAGRAGLGRGDFYAEPAPRVGLHAPSRRWHLAKVMIEKAWLHGWF
jgi:sulfide:quinone oxidoreductase